jgi:hypothetical protein
MMEGFGDWLGNGNVSNQSKVFLPYSKAKKYIHKLHLKSVKEWNEYFRNNARPSFIPRNPAEAYKKKGWMGWEDFVGKK